MTVEQLVNIVLTELEEMNKKDRSEFINKVRDKYCIYCGRFHGNDILPCRCWDNE